MFLQWRSIEPLGGFWKLSHYISALISTDVWHQQDTLRGNWIGLLPSQKKDGNHRVSPRCIWTRTKLCDTSAHSTSLHFETYTRASLWNSFGFGLNSDSTVSNTCKCYWARIFTFAVLTVLWVKHHYCLRKLRFRDGTLHNATQVSMVKLHFNSAVLKSSAEFPAPNCGRLGFTYLDFL